VLGEGRRRVRHKRAGQPTDIHVAKRIAMSTKQTHPTKEQIRRYMEERKVERIPPPSLEENRRRLEWIYQKDRFKNLR
jgi:hypothetical protein